MRFVFWHSSLVTYRETLVGLVQIMNLGGIAMGLPCDCNGLNLGGITIRRNSVGLQRNS